MGSCMCGEQLERYSEPVNLHILILWFMLFLESMDCFFHEVAFQALKFLELEEGHHIQHILHQNICLLSAPGGKSIFTLLILQHL